jgi:hypothetical protein
MVDVLVDVDVSGLEKLADRLEAELAGAVAKAAFLIEAYAKMSAPVDTGALRASLYTSTWDSGSDWGKATAEASALRSGAKDIEVEFDEGHWVYKNWDIVGGLSFLPRSNHVYKLAPYEEIDERKYKELSAKIPDIDFSKIVLYEMVDQTEGAKELACVGGTCEIQ